MCCSPRSRPFAWLRAVVFVATVASIVGTPVRASAQQLTLADLFQMPGKVIAQGTNTSPVGQYGMKSYKVEEVTLSGPTEIDVDGETIVADRVWRITITGGRFPVRAIPPTIWFDNVALRHGTETTDLTGVAAIMFDRSQLRDGVTISLSYGGEDRVPLPERLKLGDGGK